MKVNATVNETDVDNDDGRSVEGLEVTCTRCGQCVQVFGTDTPSRKRAGFMLRDECPRGENNFYEVEGA